MEKRIKLDEYKLPIRDRTEEIGFTLVDEEDYIKYKDLQLHLTHGHAHSSLGFLHRIIMNANPGEIVDHINNDRLYNRKSNLRIVNRKINARNRTKNKNTSSKFHGVSLANNKWQCHVKVNTKNLSFRFDNEHHAAYYRDVLVLKYELIGTKLNNIERPDDFVEPVIRCKQKTNIRILPNGNFEARLGVNNKTISIGTFKTYEEAILAYNNKKEELEKNAEQIRLTTPIKRNIDGIAIIDLFDKKREKVGESLIDDNQYYNATKYRWSVSHGYVSGIIGANNIRLHRFLMNANVDDPLINHKNRNRLDNRLENLEFSTCSINNHNRTKKNNATSKYYGVYKSNQKYQAMIAKDNKQYHIGRYHNEIDAAIAYNVKATELYGKNALLNIL
jgi:hypothetical protein